jgi:thiosulfate/3-mercaptopyruvate sulfurtransferase
MAGLVDIKWLAAHLGAPNIRPIDGTWVMPGGENALPTGFIPGAVSFDLDKVASPHPTLKHMLPSAEIFAKAVSDMGLSPSDHIICYDRHGMFSAPRLWWTFRMFGHDNISILDGGLPAWIKSGGVLQDKETMYKTTAYTVKHAHSNVISFEEFCANSDAQIIDARPTGRFNGTSPEPRAGLRSGHVPNSFSLPFGQMRTPDGRFKDLDSVASLIHAAAIDLDKPIITTCGSGITAAGLAFLMEACGAKNISVYDGSWAEYGASNAPVTTQSSK